ncbi:putative leader peptide [Actinoalloteichus hymeniacidonis]
MAPLLTSRRHVDFHRLSSALCPSHRSFRSIGISNRF